MSMKVFYTKAVAIVFILMLIISYYYSCASQSVIGSGFPVIVLLLPFAFALIFLIFILLNIKTLKRPFGLTILLLVLLFIYLYSLLVFSICGDKFGYLEYKYSIVYPISFIFFILFFRQNLELTTFVIDISFYVLLIFFLIFIYFVPLSFTDSGHVGTLNTSYFILCLYPITMLSKKRLVKILSTIMMFIAVVLSAKRGGIVAAATGFVCSYIANVIFNNKNNKFLLFLQLLLALSVVFTLFIYVDNFTGGYVTDRFSNTIEDGGDQSRFNIFNGVLYSFSQSNIFEQLFGHGPLSVKMTNIQHLTAHNDFLEMLYDYGIVALIVYLLIIWDFIKKVIRSIKNRSYWMFPSIFSICTIIILSMVSHIVIMDYFIFIIIFWSIIDALEFNSKNNQI